MIFEELYNCPTLYPLSLNYSHLLKAITEIDMNEKWELLAYFNKVYFNTDL